MKKKGSSMIEIILVLALIGIFFGLTAIYNQTSQLRADVNSQAELIVGNLRLLRSNAISGNVSGHNAVKLGNSSYTKFIGENFSPDGGNNFEVELPPTITITNLNLNGGVDQIVFSSPSGDTQNFGSFDLYSDRINRTITINISQIGQIDY